MNNILKFLPLLLKGKDIFDAYEEENNKKKPFWMSRRFVGAVFVMISAGLAIHSGVTIDPTDIEHITDQTMTFMQSVEVFLSAGFGLYGSTLATVGTIKRKKK